MLQTFRKWFVLGMFALLILFGLMVTLGPMFSPRLAEMAAKNRAAPAKSAVLPASTNQ